MYFPASSLTGSICKISRQKKNWKKKQILYSQYQYFGNSWCFLTCALQLLVCEKVFGQYEHLKGFSPVCVKICLLMYDEVFIIVLQNGHPYWWGPYLIGSFCKKIIRRNFYLLCKMIWDYGPNHLLHWRQVSIIKT